jgi:hypothetical protein
MRSNNALHVSQLLVIIFLVSLSFDMKRMVVLFFSFSARFTIAEQPKLAVLFNETGNGAREYRKLRMKYHVSS